MVTGQPVSIANLKLDNLSGINALLSLRHSSLVLRDFGPLLQRHLAHDPLGATKIWIYHIGRNSFNLLLPGVVSLQDVGEVCRRIAAELDSRINSRNVAEYYASFGVSIAPHIQPMRMGDIPSLRGNTPGLTIINSAVCQMTADSPPHTLTRFHNSANFPSAPESY